MYFLYFVYIMFTLFKTINFSFSILFLFSKKLMLRFSCFHFGISFLTLKNLILFSSVTKSCSVSRLFEYEYQKHANLHF